jgi:translation initiation factor 1 (eIF-1/SUI1)
MALATGIEIAGDVMRCVVLAGAAKAPKLKTAFACALSVSPDEQDSQGKKAEMIKAVLKEKGVPLSNVTLALDGRQIFCREVVVPFTRNDQIQKTIKFETEEFMPAAPVESMVVDYYKVAEIDGKSRVLVCGVQKPYLTETLEFCRQADFVPRALDFDSACLANTGFAASIFPSLTVEKTEEGAEVRTHVTCAALDISPEVTRLVLVEDGSLRRARTFKAAVDPNNPEDSALKKIAREVKRTEASCSLAAPVSIVYLTGPAYSMNLGAMLRQVMEVEVQHLPLETLVGTEDPQQVASLSEGGSIAFGAALKGLGADVPGFDFRKEEFTLRTAFDELKAGLSCTACLAFFLAFMLAYSFNLRLSQDRYALDKVRENAKTTYLALLPGEPLRSYDTLSIAKSFEDALERRRGRRVSDKVPKIISALDILKDFGEAVKAANVPFKMTDCRIDQNSVRISGIVEDKLHVGSIDKKIGEMSEYLVFNGYTDKEKDGQVTVDLRLSIK